MASSANLKEAAPPPVSHIRHAPNDILEIEFRYYTQQLEEFIPKIDDHDLRDNLNLWMARLLRDHFAIQKKMREQRNKYLHFMVACCASGIFESPITEKPPNELWEFKDIKFPKAEESKWEKENLWKQMLTDINTAYTRVPYMLENKPLTCYFHKEQHCTKDTPKDNLSGKTLDNLFSFMLWKARSMIAPLKLSSDIQKACSWLKTLAQIDKNHCLKAKSNRNDYTMLMLGYLHDGALQGPFRLFPTSPVIPLQEAAKLLSPERPKSLEVSLKGQAQDLANMEEGAFACIYIKL